jgi:hypothetical protein
MKAKIGEICIGGLSGKKWKLVSGADPGFPAWKRTNNEDMTMNYLIHKTDIEIYNACYPAEVTYVYHKAEYGERDAYGVQLEPDYPPEIEIQRVKIKADGVWHRLPYLKDVYNGLEGEIWEDISKDSLE